MFEPLRYFPYRVEVYKLVPRQTCMPAHHTPNVTPPSPVARTYPCRREVDKLARVSVKLREHEGSSHRSCPLPGSSRTRDLPTPSEQGKRSQRESPDLVRRATSGVQALTKPTSPEQTHVLRASSWIRNRERRGGVTRRSPHLLRRTGGIVDTCSVTTFVPIGSASRCVPKTMLLYGVSGSYPYEHRGREATITGESTWT